MPRPGRPGGRGNLPGYEYIAWNGYAVMGGVPEEVRKRLAEVLLPITREPQIVETFNKLGIDALGTTPEEALATSVRTSRSIRRSSISQACDSSSAR